MDAVLSVFRTFTKELIKLGLVAYEAVADAVTSTTEAGKALWAEAQAESRAATRLTSEGAWIVGDTSIDTTRAPTLDHVKDRLREGAQGLPQSHRSVLREFLEWMQREGKDVRWLINRLEEGGLRAHVASWIGPGDNRPLSAGQVEQTLGRAHIAQIAEGAGQSPSVASEILGTVVPMVIDKLTPHGKLPHESLLGEGLTFLADLLVAAVA